MVDYKLRLGDGTTFSVDEKGLTTWLQGGLVDDKARVQPAGSKKWFTLKQVLAAQGAQRGHAERQTEKGRADVDRQAAEEVAEIERKVAEQRAAEERKAAEDLAAAERKAAEERTAAERKLIEEREAAKRRAEEEKAAAEARAAAEIQAEKDRVEAERRAAEERAAAERTEAEAREAARVAEAEKLVAAERAERAERKRKAEEARLEAEQRAAEDARLAAERKAAEDRAKERKAAEDRAAAERKAAEAQAAAARREAEAKEAAALEAARVAEAERAVAAERAERAERKRRAEEERAARERDAAMDAFHVSDLAEPPATAITIDAEPPATGFAMADERSARGFATADDAPAIGFAADAEPPAAEIAIEPSAKMTKVEDFQRELALKPIRFADEAGGDSTARRGDRARASGAERSETMFSEGGGEEAPRTVVKTPAALDNVVLRLVKTLDRGVVWVVKTLVPLAGDSVARSVRSLKAVVPKLKGLLARRASSAESPSADAPAAASPVAPAPWSEPTPAPAPLATPPPAPAPRAAAAPPPPWAAPAAEPPKAQASLTVKARPKAQDVPRKPATPPPSYQKLDVIPFAAAPAGPKAEEEVWDGEDAWEEPGAVSSMFSTLWLWVKRATIVSAVVVTAALLYLNKEKWLPGAKSAAIVLGQQVDELSERASTRTVPPEAIAAAQAEVPYLRAQTIELIMAQSTEGVLEPAEVFHRAHQAVERARPSLPNQVAAEIDHHTAAVVAELDPLEAEQLRGYLAALRAGTATAAYQDKGAVWLMARGVRRLPAERIARMQELFAQAVTSVLQPSPKP